MTKYRELPCYEKNEFQAGDFIIVYDRASSFHATVESVGADFVFLPKHGLGHHFKQCRKLEPIPPREFWISVYTADILHDRNDVPNNKEGFVKMREVED